MTAIDNGKDGTSNHEDNNIGLEIRDNAGGQVWNSIFTEFAKSIMDVEATSSSKGTQSTTDSSVYGSQALMQNGVLVFKGNLFYNGGHSDGNTASGTAEGDSSYRGAFDGIADWTTWTKVTTDTYLAPLTSDFDNDSLTLAQEISSTYKTDPSIADTDGDGTSDPTDSAPLDASVGGSVTASIKGDFDSDGIPDIVWQKPGTNETKFWFMNTDGTKKSELDLSHTAGVVWRFASMADMNNDGKEDMLWQKEDGSTVFCYYMDGSGGVSSGVSLASGVASGWKFASASDYNGDGNADFLWHNTAKGSTVSWHFDGNGVVNGFSPLGSGIGDVFNSYGGQDMNADGNSDVIYQNSNNGRVLVWYFDDKKNILGTKKYFTTLDTSLKVVGAKDYDKDGAVDILLQHSTTGVAKIVYFDTAGTELSEKEIGTVDTTTLWDIRN